jgi:hypothetical protein
MLSDHGTNFVALSKSTDMPPWEFIVERGPWWGGAWERLIGVVKGLLKRTLGSSRQTWEELDTVFKRVESIVNRRPTSHQWTAAEGGAVPVPICPELFLYPPSPDAPERLADGLIKLRAWEAGMESLWRDLYLHQVLGREGSRIWKKAGKRVKEGDVVLLERPGNRTTWPLALVESLLPGYDGCRRVAILRTRGGRLRRPVQRLFPLEVVGPERPRTSSEAVDVTPGADAGSEAVDAASGADAGSADADASTEAGDANAEGVGGDAGGDLPREGAPKRTTSGRVVKRPIRFQL